MYPYKVHDTNKVYPCQIYVPQKGTLSSDMSMERFGEKVRTLRKQRGLSLRALAIELGLATHSHLDRIESGENKPSADLILKIADYFGICIDQLMRDEREIEQ
jgi:ribosome-binding protein aMBF1 (putative translation factor)